MSFHYGSDSSQIPNPFKAEGIVFIAGGVFSFIVGLISVFTLRRQVLISGAATGWINLFISLAILGIGASFVCSGLFRIFRFYVGKNVPSSLSVNYSQSESHMRESGVVYSPEDLLQVLEGRKNPTFVEPDSFVERLVYSIFPNMVFLPYAIRNYINFLIKNAAFTIMALVIYLFVLISGSIGLTKLTKTSFSSWMGIGLIFVFLAVWGFNQMSAKRANRARVGSSNTRGFVFSIVLAVIVPALGEIMVSKGVKIPAAPFNPALNIIVFLFLMSVSTAAGLLLAHKRSETLEPLTEVSEYRDNWQENIHPKDVFRSFDIEMANLRYKEIPNRVYLKLNPSLQMEGSLDKGSFSGNTILETQPVFEKIEYPEILKKMRLVVTTYGHILVGLSSIVFFIASLRISNSSSFWSITNLLCMPLFLLIFGLITINSSHFYWAEMSFKSYLINFRIEGTYSESKLSVGHSARSENKIIKASFSPWIILSEIASTTFAGTGSRKLEGARYIMDIRKADDILDKLVKSIRNYLDKNELIASTSSENDLNSIKNLRAMNQAFSQNKNNEISIAANEQAKINGN